MNDQLEQRVSELEVAVAALKEELAVARAESVAIAESMQKFAVQMGEFCDSVTARLPRAL